MNHNEAISVMRRKQAEFALKKDFAAQCGVGDTQVISVFKKRSLAPKKMLRFCGLRLVKITQHYSVTGKLINKEVEYEYV